MFNYTGYECKVCSKKFNDDDEIVVCPECGTPYHRECYNNEGHCVNTELHEKNISWKADIEAKESENKTDVKCRNCGNDLKSDQLFCDRCGTPSDVFFKSKSADEQDRGYADNSREAMEALHPYMINYSDPLCGFNPDETYDEGVSLRDIGDFVKTNTHYYLPKFRMMKAFNFKISFNFLAMVFPEFFFANRKMPLAATMILIIKTIIGLPASAVSLQQTFSHEKFGQLFRESMPIPSELIDKLMAIDFNGAYFSTLLNMSSVLNWAQIFICAGFANYFYYRHVLSKIKSIKTDTVPSDVSVSERLRSNGGTSAAMLVLFIVLYFISSYISMGAVFLLI